MRVRLKKEQVTTVFQNLKRNGPIQIDLNSPSPDTKRRTFPKETGASSSKSSVAPHAANVVRNPDFFDREDGDLDDIAVGGGPDDDGDLEKQQKAARNPRGAG